MTQLRALLHVTAGPLGLIPGGGTMLVYFFQSASLWQATLRPYGTVIAFTIIQHLLNVSIRTKYMYLRQNATLPSFNDPRYCVLFETNRVELSCNEGDRTAFVVRPQQRSESGPSCSLRMLNHPSQEELSNRFQLQGAP